MTHPVIKMILKKISVLQKVCTKKRCLALLSLISTPFIIFIITSVELYLKNKIDLDNKLIVLAPFFILFLLTIIIGCFFYYYSQKNKIAKLFLFVYYLAGPAFLVYSVIRQVRADNFVKLLFIIILFGLILLFLCKKTETFKVVKIFFWLACILIIGELLIIFNDIYRTSSKNQENIYANIPAQNQADKNLPNIYHIVFDEYQTDMFDLTLNEEVKKQLAGFTFYPNDVTVYGRTGMSLPSMFTSLSYDYEIPQIEYQKQAFGSDKSLLFWLKKAGYQTNAYIHKVFTFELKLFDLVIEHKNNTFLRPNNVAYIKQFSNLWVYANAPRAISKRIIKPESLDQIKNQNVLPSAAPIVSYESFENILNNEELLDSSGQYFFIHLILPHFPYVLKSDCSYEGDSETSPLKQSRCATKMITELIGVLKKSKRFDNSLIIIQSDHGSRFKAENNDLTKVSGGYYSEEWSLARSRALLLVKTPGKNNSDSLDISYAKTSLLDITPTVIKALGIESGLTGEGYSLTNPESIPSDRLRYYNFYDKEGSNEKTDELSRYIVDGDTIKFDKKIPVKNVEIKK